MKKIELDIVALSHSVTQSHNYAVVLGEMEGVRRLPIVIGGAEAQSIAIAMERMTPNRPLTHDLLKNTMLTFNIDLKEVIINNLHEGVFYARLICAKEGEIVEVDSRTSDALALAVRFGCPIYTYEFILEAAGVVLEDGDSDEDKQQQPKEDKPNAPKKRRQKKGEKTITERSIDELNTMLEDVLSNEDYEKAAKIRDEINRRQEES